MDPSHFLIIAAMITTVGIGVLILSSLVQWTASEVGNFPRQTVVLLGWVLVMIGILIGSVLVGMVPGVIALIVAAMVIQRSLRAPRQALLWTLAIATERSIPLVPAVEAFAQERGGLLGSRARNLAQYLRGLAASRRTRAERHGRFWRGVGGDPRRTGERQFGGRAAPSGRCALRHGRRLGSVQRPARLPLHCVPLRPEHSNLPRPEDHARDAADFP